MSGPKATSSNTVGQNNCSSGSWNTIPTLRRTAVSVSFFTSIPATFTRPLEGSSTPFSRLMKVDLPAPLGPIKATFSSCRRRHETPSSTVCPSGEVKCTSWTSIAILSFIRRTPPGRSILALLCYAEHTRRIDAQQCQRQHHHQCGLPYVFTASLEFQQSVKFSLVAFRQHGFINALRALETAHQQRADKAAHHLQGAAVGALHETARTHRSIHALHFGEKYEDVAVSEQQHLDHRLGAL